MPAPTPVPRNNIFVVGCQRSGTSVVYGCLVSHPELRPLRPYDPETGYDPKELYYFRNIFEARKQFRSPMYDWDVDKEYLRGLLEFTVRFCAEHHGTASGRWISAHPADGLHLAEILEAMPEVRVIYVLRHPQEAVWSMLHAPWVSNAEGIFEERVRRYAGHWRSFAHIALDVVRGLYGDSVLLVRHEKIVHDPDAVARAIIKHVGVPAHAAVGRQLGAPTFNSSFRNQADPREAMYATRCAITREPWYRREVIRQVGREMEALGYADLGDPPRWLELMLAAVSRRSRDVVRRVAGWRDHRRSLR